MKSSMMRSVAIATLAMSAVFASAQNIKVEVNGERVNFNNAEPRYMDGRVLVPLRGVFEEMGASVQWHPMTRTVTAQKGERDVTLRIGERWATVDGQTMSLDVPARIINGATMVPIRFVSEALGAHVAWMDPTRTVVISTTDVVVNNNNRPLEFENRRVFTLDEGTVIPVTLRTRVTSKEARRGDLVRAEITGFNSSSNYESGYFDFPKGTLLEGRVSSAVPKQGDQPGLIELDFGRIVMPDGRTVNIDGSLISLDSNSVARNENGVLVAKTTNKDNRMVYAGYGAGAGLLIGLLTNRTLESAALGGILGYLAGTLEQSQRRPNDVVLEPGTRFGVRLDSPVSLTIPNGGR